MPSKRHYPIKVGPFNRCKVCGEPKGEREVWSVELDFFEHEECRDWAKTSFPLDGKLFVARQLAHDAKHAFEATVALGLELKAACDGWPDNALERLKTIREHRARVTDAIAKVLVYKDWFH